MSVKQMPSGEWYYRFQIGMRTFRKQGFRVRAEAEAAETLKKAELVRRRASGQSLNDDLKLCDAADAFFDEYVVPSTRCWKEYRAHIRTMKEFFQKKRIRDITPRDVDAFRIYVAKTIKWKGWRPITQHTVNHYHAHLKAIINWARKRRMYSGENPAWGVPMARVEKARVRFLLPDEEKRLTPVVAKNTRLWPFYLIALHTGMRIGEICNILVQDVIRHPDPMIFIPHAKSKRSRYVPLSGPVLDVVANRLIGKAPGNRLLDVVEPRTVSEWFNDACAEAQVKNFTFHCLRHSFASYLLSRGVPIYKVSKMLGHSGVGVTEQHYGHMDRSVLADEIKHVEGIVTLPQVPGGDSGVFCRSAVKQAVNKEILPIAKAV